MVSALSASADALVIGDGVIGLSTAYALAQAGAACLIIGARKAGMASAAAAGLLQPRLGVLPEMVRPFFRASLDAYPGFIAQLRAYDESLAIVYGLTEHTAETGPGGWFHPGDGAVDTTRLIAALRTAIGDMPNITIVEDDPAIRVEIGRERCAVWTRTGSPWHTRHLILAAGAWTPEIAGLPRPLPIRPLKGQMLALGASPLSHSLAGNDVYLVPRGNETLVGATVEHAGFDVRTTERAIDGLHRAALQLCPKLAGAPITRVWAGIRPATPDMLPILGRDPDVPRLLYACGHGKNGILLAPATATAIARLAQEQLLDVDLRPFSVSRFFNDSGNTGA